VKRKLFAALLLLSGCWPPTTRADCYTRRGMQLRGSHDCEGFQEMEDAALAALEARGHRTETRWVEVYVRPDGDVDGRFTKDPLKGYWGYTDCVVPGVITVITLGDADWHHHGVLTHELGHHATSCQPANQNHPADVWGCQPAPSDGTWKECEPGDDRTFGIYGAQRETTRK
jgi:hypothetical protein